MKDISAWRVAFYVAGLAAATEALPYPNCEADASAAAVFVAGRIAGGQELDDLYDSYFVRALQKQMERAALVDLSRSLIPSASGGPPAARPILMKPLMREVDQLAVKNFTKLSGAAVGATVGVIGSRPAGVIDLLMTLQCQDGHWKLAGISVGAPERR
jgi:hypothetical protein